MASFLEERFAAVFAAFPDASPARSVIRACDAAVGAACGCYACDDGVQPGHVYCEQPTGWALELERAGKIVRSLDSSWRWEIN